MKSIIKIIPVVFIIVGLIVQSLGCTSAEAQTAEDQIVTVQRGDLRVDITAAGNLALSRTEDLAFDIFYPEATVEEVLVEEGDIVEEGQVLARLDEDEWDEQLSDLEDELATAKRQLRDARLQIPAKEIALLEAQINLEQAEYNLAQIEDVKEAQDDVDDAELRLECVKLILLGEFGGGLQTFDYGYWQQLKSRAEVELAEAQEDLQDILDDISLTVSRDVALDVAKKKLLVEQKRIALEDAQLDVEDAQTDLEDAQEDVDDVQEEWEDVKSKSPAITAPFAGFITRVNVEGGDEVMTGTVAVQLADPGQFEAEIMVSEMDISQVKEGGDAQVEVDALSGLTLPAKVTHIAPTATIQSGVVNYKVKVEVASLEEMMQEQQAARQEATEKIQQGELPERLKQAIESGQITQEQAEEMMRQMQEWQQQPQAQMPTMMPENFQLREGLTVTVSIIIEEKTGVLLVPNAAITTERGQSYVQVVSPDGTTEKRAIKTGITDYQFTEVIEGLAEGEQIIVPEGTTTTPTTQQRPRGMMMFGGPPR